MCEEKDTELYNRLWYADQDGEVEIGIDLRLYNKSGSPTFDQRDNALPVVGTVCVAATAFFLGGWVWGIALLVSGVIFSLSTLNIWLMHRLRLRTLVIGRSGLPGWEELWTYGGVSLRRKGEEAETNAPLQDWRAFAQRLPHESSYGH